MHRVSLVLLAAVCLSSPHGAWANGAFPDSEGLLLPPDEPALIVLATNFGLVASEDGGASWRWTCETEETSFGTLYSTSAGPRPRFFSVARPGLAFTDDLGCTWRLATGALAGLRVVDAFPDPRDPMRVLAAAAPPVGDAGAPGAGVYVSDDRGATFRGPLFTVPADAEITGLESASSDPRILYVAWRQEPGERPRLSRSDDGGATFRTFDLEPSLGKREIRIAAVDPVRPTRVYLRALPVAGASGDALVVTNDGGASVSVAVDLPNGRLTAFLRRQSGTVLAAGIVGDGLGTPVGFRAAPTGSDAGAPVFEPWPLAVRPRALAERDGVLYAALDDVADRFAVGISADEGASFRPLLRYQEVRSIRACAYAACFEDCINRSFVGLWSEAMCRAREVPDGGIRDGGRDAGPPADEPSGCGCRVGARAQGGGVAALLLLLFLLARRQARAQSGGSAKR